MQAAATSGKQPAWGGTAEVCTELRLILGRAYGADLYAALGVRSLALLGASDVPMLRLRLRERQPNNAVAELFLLGCDVDRMTAEAVLAPIELVTLEQAGLIKVHDQLVTARVSIVALDCLFLAGDRLDMRDVPASMQVPNTDLSTQLLQYFTIRRPVTSMLDIGTGTGVHAMLAAAHADTVVGIDINPRAVASAQFNALFNACPKVDIREGSWFEPVAGERFDLLVANPPFVISPLSGDPHRYSGQPGDELCRQLISAAPDHLTEGGLAHVMCDWIHTDDEEPFAPLRRWVHGRGCDAVFLHFSSDDPVAYAATYDREEQREPELVEESVTRWLDAYRALRIQRIASGAVILRKREGTNWMRGFHLELLATWRAEAGPDDTGLLITNNGRFLDRYAITRMLDRCPRVAGIGHVHPHQLRHTLATQAINRGMSLEAIAAMLGHISMRMTLVYARIADRTVADQYYAAANQIDAMYETP